MKTSTQTLSLASKQSNIFKKLSMLSLGIVAAATLLIQSPVFAQDEAPGRVARVTYSFGSISFADAGSNTWTELMNNRPISTGDSLFVPDRGRAEIHVGANALRLSEETRVSFVELTDDLSHIQLSQGRMSVHVRALQEKERFEINTPNLTFSIQEPGEYRININDDNTTTIIVRRGLGLALGSRDVITLAEGEQTTFKGTNLRHTQIARAPSMDTFDLWVLDRSRAEENSISARYVSREVIGYQQLDNYGTWSTHQEYGNVWYPRNVSSHWAPYRDGKWVWVSPWGWTWVDSAPWGFAPYHYGRWAHIHSRWAWVPGKHHHNHRPTYAPALVAFVGSRGNGVSVGISISSGHSRGFDNSVSWFPLGPHEAYHPSYTRNPHYIRNINQTVINNTTIINGNNNQVYINQHVNNAVTTIPTKSFVRGEYVRPQSSSILSGQVKQLQAMTQSPNLQPEKNNRYGEARTNSIHTEQTPRQNNAGIATSTVYGSGIYAGGNAIPVTPHPSENALRQNRSENNSRRNSNSQQSNATISSGNQMYQNNSRPMTSQSNNSSRIISDSNDNRPTIRRNDENMERFDTHMVSESTRRNEAYRGTPDNPRAINAPVIISRQEPVMQQNVPQAMDEPRQSSNNMMRGFERQVEREMQVQQQRPSIRSEAMEQGNREMRAPRQEQQAARNEPRPAAIAVQREAPARQSTEKQENRKQLEHNTHEQ